jgi:hypothetical protein
VLVVSFTGCNRGGDEDTAASPRTSTPAPTPCSVPDGSLQPQRSDTNPESAPVTAVRYTRRTEEGCPRIVFEFTDHVPGYAVAYADGPFSECGSGDAVPTDGWDATAFLTVRLEPSASVDTTDPNASQTYTGPRDIDVGGRVLKHMKVICDFEAVFEWVVGLDAKHDFAVFTLDDPSRIVIDVSET